MVRRRRGTDTVVQGKMTARSTGHSIEPKAFRGKNVRSSGPAGQMLAYPLRSQILSLSVPPPYFCFRSTLIQWSHYNCRVGRWGSLPLASDSISCQFSCQFHNFRELGCPFPSDRCSPTLLGWLVT
jgi:hypothetical protein